jgi:hypothetical protein
MKGAEHREGQPLPEPENRERRALLRKGVRYTVGTGLLAYGLTEALTVTRKKIRLSNEAITNVTARGIKPPDDAKVKEAGLMRDESNNLVQVNPTRTVTLQQTEVVAQNEAFVWATRQDYRNNPDRPADFREPASYVGIVIGAVMDAAVAILIIDTIHDKVANWGDRFERFIERRNAARAQKEDQ